MSIRRMAFAALVLSWGINLPADAQSVAGDPRVLSALELARTWLEAERAYERIPGISAAIVHDQEVLWSGGFGKADLSDGRAASADTIYSICSISKLFTSVAVLRQRDAGKLHLEDPVGKHLSWFHLKRTEGEGDAKARRVCQEALDGDAGIGLSVLVGARFSFSDARADCRKARDPGGALLP